MTKLIIFSLLLMGNITFYGMNLKKNDMMNKKETQKTEQNQNKIHTLPAPFIVYKKDKQQQNNNDKQKSKL